MSIFSSIGKALKSIGSSVAKTLSPVYNTVSGLIKGANNVASAAKPTFGSYQYMRDTAKMGSTYGVGGKVPMGATGRWDAPPATSKSSGSSGAPAISLANWFGMQPAKSVSAGSSGVNKGSASYSTDYGGITSALTGFSSYLNNMPVSTTVSASQIGSGTPSVVAPSSPSPVDYGGQNVANNTALGADEKTGMFKNIQPVDTMQTAPKETDSQKAFKDYIASLRPPESDAELYQKSVEQSGLLEAKQRVQNTQSQINAVTSKMNADLLQLRGTAAKEGVVEAVYGGQQAQVTREATIKLLPLQAQLAADQGNLEMAQENTNILFKMYSDDAKRSADFYNENVKAAYDLFTKDEKKRVDEILWQKNFNADMIKKEADNQNELAQQMLKSGNMTGYRAVTGIQIPHNVNSPTFAEDYQDYKNELANTASRFGVQAQQQTQTKTGVLASLPTSIQTKIISKADSLGSSDIGKKYNATVDSINIVNGIDPKSKNPADHQTIVYAFAKSLDPDSVVREGEYATIKKYAQSAVNRYGKEITNAISGNGFLSVKAIADIQKTMQNNYSSRKPQFDNLMKETKRVINNIAGQDIADEIMIDYEGGVTQQQSQQPQQFQLPDGTTVTLQADGTYK